MFTPEQRRKPRAKRGELSERLCGLATSNVNTARTSTATERARERRREGARGCQSTEYQYSHRYHLAITSGVR